MEIQIYNKQGRPLNEVEMKYLEDMVDKHLVEVVGTAEGFAVRAFLVGRVIAEFAQMGLTAEDIEVTLMPLTVKALARKLGKLTPQEKMAIEFAKQRAAEHITRMNNAVKAQIRQVIWQGLKERKNPLVVSQELFRQFGEFNRDWRRIAITEANAASGDAYMQQMIKDQKIRGKKETKLLGQSAVDACPWCKENIHGKVFDLISVDEAPIHDLDSKLWDTAIWPGKNNVKRYYSKRKWITSPEGTKTLIDRPNSELAKPTISAHPYCRCWFTPYFEGMPIGKDGYVE